VGVMAVQLTITEASGADLEVHPHLCVRFLLGPGDQAAAAPSPIQGEES
jgi:hypothetical protein